MSACTVSLSEGAADPVFLQAYLTMKLNLLLTHQDTHLYLFKFFLFVCVCDIISVFYVIYFEADLTGKSGMIWNLGSHCLGLYMQRLST